MNKFKLFSKGCVANLIKCIQQCEVALSVQSNLRPDLLPLAFLLSIESKNCPGLVQILTWLPSREDQNMKRPDSSLEPSIIVNIVMSIH